MPRKQSRISLTYLTIRAIFVLHLHHDDGAAVLYGERLQLLADLFLEELHAFHEVGVALTQLDVFLLEEPPRQTAHLPFGTNVWAWAYDDIHAVLLCQTAELGHVVIVGEVELAFLLLVDVPEDVDADRVHAQRLAHLYAMLPIRARDARIMHFGRLHDERLSVQEESLVANGEVVCSDTCREQHQCNEC